MTTYFLDTNALVKLYAFDSTSYWTIGIVANRRPRHRIVVSDIVQVEVPSALYKLERVDATIAAQTDLAVKRFNRDLRAAHGASCECTLCKLAPSYKRRVGAAR
jgi:predicted nucleic acid-binding protein